MWVSKARSAEKITPRPQVLIMNVLRKTPGIL